MKQLLLFAFLSLALTGESQSWVSATPYADPWLGVNDIEVHNGDIYIGGSFNEVGGIVANRVAKWDGNAWSTVGNDFVNNTVSDDVYKLLSNNGVLYALCGQSQYNSKLYYFDGSDWVYTNLDQVSCMCLFVLSRPL